MSNLKNTYAQRHYESALDFFEQGQYDKALQQIEKAIQQSPNNPDMYSTKGVFFHRMNNLVKAIEAYRSALKVAPDHTFSHYNLGLIYMKQNKVLQAIQEWESVIRIKPDDADAIFNIAVALSHLGKSQQAIPFYEKVVDICPEHVQTHQNLGVIFRDAGDFARAKYHLKRLKELDSTYIEVVESEIMKCEEQEFIIKLKSDNLRLSNSLESNSTDVLTDSLSALIEEKFEQALHLSEIFLEKSPDDLQAKLIKGQALNALSRSADAIALFMQILVDNPDSLDAMFHLGNIFLGIGEMEKALGYFERILKFDPEHPLVQENIDSIRKRLLIEKSDD